MRVSKVVKHTHKKDHIAHLCPAQVVGIGALLALDHDVICQAVGNPSIANNSGTETVPVAVPPFPSLMV